MLKYYKRFSIFVKSKKTIGIFVGFFMYYFKYVMYM